MADSRIPADVNDAVYDLVRDFGVDKLAARTGTSAGVIYNKTSRSESEHNKPTLADALIWTQIAGDYRIAHAFCRTLGGAFVPLHHLAQQSDAALLDLLLRRDKEQGDFAQVLADTISRGRVLEADYQVLHREGYEAIAAELELLLRLEDMSRG